MAVSKNQKMVTCGRSLLEVKRIVYLGSYRQGLLTGRGGSVTFWAWMAEIAVYLIVLTAGRIFEAAKPGNKGLGDLAKPSVSESVYVLPGSKVLSPRIEFFGSFTDRRKVCYLVDCSWQYAGGVRSGSEKA